MTSEPSSTTNSRKRKLVDSEVDEVFVLQKKPELTATKTVSLSIPDMLKKIEDENKKKNSINAPSFKLGNLNFYLYVIPEQDEGYVGFYIRNPNRENQIISMQVIEGPRTIDNFNCEIVQAKHSMGWRSFLSHDAYRQWAGEKGDVFKITASVTLHITEESSDEEWKTLK